MSTDRDCLVPTPAAGDVAGGWTAQSEEVLQFLQYRHRDEPTVRLHRQFCQGPLIDFTEKVQIADRVEIHDIGILGISFG